MIDPHLDFVRFKIWTAVDYFFRIVSFLSFPITFPLRGVSAKLIATRKRKTNKFKYMKNKKNETTRNIEFPSTSAMLIFPGSLAIYPWIPVCKCQEEISQLVEHAFKNVRQRPLSISNDRDNEQTKSRLARGISWSAESGNSSDQSRVLRVLESYFPWWRTGRTGIVPVAEWNGSCAIRVLFVPIPVFPERVVPVLSGSNGIGNLRDWCKPRGWNINSWG